MGLDASSKLSQLISYYSNQIREAETTSLDIGFSDSGIFHIHPQCIARNFIRTRQEFYENLVTLQTVLNVQSMNELLQLTNIKKAQQILDHFGVNIKIKLCKHKSKKSKTIIKSSKCNNIQKRAPLLIQPGNSLKPLHLTRGAYKAFYDIFRLYASNVDIINEPIGSKGHKFNPSCEFSSNNSIRLFQHICVANDEFSLKSQEELRFEDQFGQKAAVGPLQQYQHNVMTHNDMKRYFLKCLQDKAWAGNSASKERIDGIFKRYGDKDKLSLGGFLDFYFDACFDRPDNVWDDLEAFGYGHDLRKRDKGGQKKGITVKD